MITLVNLPSPFLFVDKDQLPLGLLYLAASLRSHGHDVEILDLAGAEDWEDQICKVDSEFVGISATTPQFNLARRAASLTDAVTVAGGPQPSVCPDLYLENGFDAVVVGEGERAVLRVLEGETGVLESPLIEDLDSIPFPAWDLVDLSSYRQHFLDKPIVHLMTSRGCPHRCAFCSHSVFQTETRFRSPDNVIAEIHALHHTHEYERLMIMDDTFGIRKDLIYPVMEELARLGILWRCHFRANLANEAFLKDMFDSGCRHMTLGVESGSDQILENISKGATVAMNTEAIQNAKRAGLKVKAFTIVGLPGETLETMEATKQWLLENRPDDFDLQIFHPYEDCHIYQHPEDYDIEFDAIDYDAYWFKGNPVSTVSTSTLTKGQIADWRNRTFEELRSIL